ncbi:AAA domain-containing protein, putative AbiEii toxin, Type IV TA system [Aureimonas phyllosphaerae]|nr:AAA domain-containing protein, putative AbiEii toxin, Type IV TA system [Aureimonas phyllosphaerae]
MYVKRIYAQNVGPLAELKLEPRFTEEGSPVPLVLVGQNGAGKSLTLSIVIDAITEMRRGVFNKIPEVEGDGYLKLSARRYVRHGFKYSISEVIMAANEAETTFREVIGVGDAAQIQAEFPNVAAIVGGDQGWSEGGFYKQAQVPEALKKDVASENFLYFPYFRYEKAAWLAETAKIDFSRETNYHGYSAVSPVRTSIIEETRKWILNVLLDRELYDKQLVSLPYQSLGLQNQGQGTINVFLGYSGPNAKLFELVNQILFEMMKAKDPTLIGARLGIGTKGDRNIGVFVTREGEQETTVAPDIGMMSSGELMTIALATEIIRVFEMVKGAPPASLNDVTGIVLIDEIDLHLHISFQKSVLPAIIRRFPKVQFIVTTHSPFFVLGMQETGVTDIISLPIGNKIAPEDFIEFQESYNVFIEKNAQFKDRYEELTKAISEDGKPIVITEGKTDWQHIKNALEIAHTNGNYADVDVEFFEFEDPITMGDTKLKQMCDSIALLPQKRDLIFVFDRDKKEIIETMSGAPDLFKSQGNRVYSLCLPVPPHRTEYKNISIEFYYTDDDLRTVDPATGKRLWFTNEVEKAVSLTTNKASFKALAAPIAEEELEKKVHDSNVNDIKNGEGEPVALSKALFVTHIIHNAELSSNFDRSAFGGVFDVFRMITNPPAA